jgi:hypothetical protein
MTMDATALSTQPLVVVFDLLLKAGVLALLISFAYRWGAMQETVRLGFTRIAEEQEKVATRLDNHGEQLKDLNKSVAVLEVKR